VASCLSRSRPQLLLPHREPLALLFVEIELGDGSGFRRSLVGCFYSPEMGALPMIGLCPGTSSLRRLRGWACEIRTAESVRELSF
jgi:hypothetical protein